MRTIFLLVIGLLIFVPFNAFSQDIEYKHYSGTIDRVVKIEMWLAFDGEKVTGSYCRVKDLKSIYLKGVIDRFETIKLIGRNNKTRQAVSLRGRFLAEDPEKKFTGKLDKEVLRGVLVEGKKSFSIIVRFTGSTIRPKGFGRYWFSNSYDEDEKIEQTIQAFREAIMKDRRREVAQFFNFPLLVWREEEKISVESEAEFVENYEYIIEPWLKKAIIESVPKNMFENYQGICLGEKCAVWFSGHDLTVIWPQTDDGEIDEE